MIITKFTNEYFTPTVYLVDDEKTDYTSKIGRIGLGGYDPLCEESKRALGIPKRINCKAIGIDIYEEENRRKGYSKILFESLIENIKDTYEYPYIFWACYQKNIASKKAALKLGFKIAYENEHVCSLYYKMGGVKMRITKDILYNLVDEANTLIDGSEGKYGLDIAYGGYKVVFNNNTEVSDRGTAKETYIFLRGLIKGLRANYKEEE